MTKPTFIEYVEDLQQYHDNFGTAYTVDDVAEYMALQETDPIKEEVVRLGVKEYITLNNNPTFVFTPPQNPFA
jgi:hypothetical protein